jgi:hypothetical protein
MGLKNRAGWHFTNRFPFLDGGLVNSGAVISYNDGSGKRKAGREARQTISDMREILEENGLRRD